MKLRVTVWLHTIVGMFSVAAVLIGLNGCTTTENQADGAHTQLGTDGDSDTQSSSASDGGDAGVTTGDGCLATAALEAEFLQLINDARAQARQCGSASFPAVGGLTWDERLEAAALVHSQDMANTNFFSHTGSDGASVGQRVTNQNYIWTTVAENLAASSAAATSDQVVNAWLNSIGHCSNIMLSDVSELGVSCWDNAGSDFERYWTLVLGDPAP